MPRIQPLQIKNIVKGAVKQAQDQKQKTKNLKRAWQAVVGKEAAKHAQPLRFMRKTLVVEVDSPVWIYYLHNNKQDIEKTLNKQLNMQYDIKIRLRAGDCGDKKNKTKKRKKTTQGAGE
jgi:predicted nucleic acid-binding Zn ribbon protein